MPYVPSKKTNLPTGDDRAELMLAINKLAGDIITTAKKYEYDGAFQGELNFAITTLIEELPKEMIRQGIAKEETRYWLQSAFFGVLLDVILEYKARANRAYEDFQIEKSGDCYRGPYYTLLVRVVNKIGDFVGFSHVSMKRSNKTVNKDIIGEYIIDY